MANFFKNTRINANIVIVVGGSGLGPTRKAAFQAFSINIGSTIRARSGPKYWDLHHSAAPCFAQSYTFFLQRLNVLHFFEFFNSDFRFGN